MNEDGFTLIETLVAMAVLAVAASGLIGASAGHVDLIRSLQSRAMAQWVAENRIVELRLGERGLPATVAMLGRKWRVTTVTRPSDDPALAMVTVAVAEASSPRPLVILRGVVAR